MASKDVTIFGAGVFGLCIAWACLARGAKVQVIDPNGVANGASGGIVGALAPHSPDNWNDKKAFQLGSLLMAQAYWDNVTAVSGLPTGYGQTGRLQPASTARELELAYMRIETAKELWQGRAHWSVINEGADWAPPSPTGFLIYDTLSARIHPRDACLSLAAALRAGGADIVTKGEEQGIVVDCTGSQGLAKLNAQLGQPVGSGVKGQAMLLKYAAPGAPQLYSGGMHIVPHYDGTVAIGSTSEREFDDATTTDSQLEELYTRAMMVFPILAGAPILRRWAGVRPRARNRAPMLGRHPLRKGAYIANGGFKIGFGMAPKVGEVMADLILEGRDEIPIGFQAEASFREEE